MIYALDKQPRIAKGCFIAPSADVIGDVELASGVNVWFGCVLRGDLNKIVVGEDSNIQDGTVIHISSGNSGYEAGATIIGKAVTVGHSAVIHACTLKDRCLVGMGATILDEAVVESGGFVAAGSVVLPATKVGAGELWAGNPARKKRMVSPKEMEMIAKTPTAYKQLASQYSQSLKVL